MKNEVSPKQTVPEETLDEAQKRLYADFKNSVDLVQTPARENNRYYHDQASEAQSVVNGLRATIAARQEAKRPGIFAPRAEKKAYRGVRRADWDAQMKLPAAERDLADKRGAEARVKREVEFQIAYAKGVKTPTDTFINGMVHYKENHDAYKEMAREEAQAAGVELNIPVEFPADKDARIVVPVEKK